MFAPVIEDFVFATFTIQRYCTVHTQPVKHILFDAENFYKHTAVKTVALQHELPRLHIKNKSDAFFSETPCICLNMLAVGLLRNQKSEENNINMHASIVII